MRRQNRFVPALFAGLAACSATICIFCASFVAAACQSYGCWTPLADAFLAFSAVGAVGTLAFLYSYVLASRPGVTAGVRGLRRTLRLEPR